MDWLEEPEPSDFDLVEDDMDEPDDDFLITKYIDQQCGSPHPNYPKLTCQRWGGQCPVDDHYGTWEHEDGRREIVVWGTHEVPARFRRIPIERTDA